MALKICAHPSLLPWPIDISSDSFFGRTKKPVVECPNKKNVFLNSFIFFSKTKTRSADPPSIANAEL
jgi:hypothetical protein